MGKDKLVSDFLNKGLCLTQALFEPEQMIAFFDSHELLNKIEVITLRSQRCYQSYKQEMYAKYLG